MFNAKKRVVFSRYVPEVFFFFVRMMVFYIKRTNKSTAALINCLRLCRDINHLCIFELYENIVVVQIQPSLLSTQDQTEICTRNKFLKPFGDNRTALLDKSFVSLIVSKLSFGSRCPIFITFRINYLDVASFQKFNKIKFHNRTERTRSYTFLFI